MALIKFLRDFRGTATNEQFYEAGSIVDLATAASVVAEGAAEFVAPEVNTPTAVEKAAEPQPELTPILATKPVSKARSKKNKGES